MPQPSLILASASPRRRELLALLGLPFHVMVADIPETPLANETGRDMAMRLSLAKAQSIWAQVQDSTIVACDTVVVLEGEILGKPADVGEAIRMLRRLRGRWHSVYSGLTVLTGCRDEGTSPGSVSTLCDETMVRMRTYTDEEIAAYVASGDPLDKAGAYAIQHAGFHPVDRLVGCYTNVMGLPLRRLAHMLRTLGHVVPDDSRLAAACAAFTEHPCCLAGGGAQSHPCCTAV